MNEHSAREDLFQILRIISLGANYTQRDLSSELGISLGKTNYLLKELIKKGLVKAENFSRNGGKVRKAQYILTKQGIKQRISLTRHFLKRKEEEYNAIKNEWAILSNRKQREKIKDRC